jgi:hypothetical protein
MKLHPIVRTLALVFLFLLGLYLFVSSILRLL